MTRPGDLTLRDLGLKFLLLMRKRCIIRRAKNGGAQCRRFLAILKTGEGLESLPHQGEGEINQGEKIERRLL